jgi:hypothetical protein
MQQAVRSSLLLLHLPLLLCSCHRSSGPIDKSATNGGFPAMRAAAMQPATAPAGPALRMTEEWRSLLKDRHEYLSKEGPLHRGHAFEQLAMTLAAQVPAPERFYGGVRRPARAGQVITELEIVMLLGAPDFYDSAPQGALLAYRYTPDGRQDPWMLFVSVDERGFVRRVGFNAESANRTGDLPPYSPSFLRAHGPRPPGSGYIGAVVEPVRWESDGHTYIGTRGVHVAQVVADSPAARAGLHVGDVIDAIGGATIGTDSFTERVAKLPPGQPVKLTVLRGGPSGERQSVTLTVGTRPSTVPTPATSP